MPGQKETRLLMGTGLFANTTATSYTTATSHSQAINLRRGNHSCAAYREDIGLFPAIVNEVASQVPTCEDYVRHNPCPRADHRRGLNIAGRTVSAATTVADPIGNLAALHQHVAGRGRVVVLVFCHSELLTSANARFAKCRAFKVRRKRFEEVVLLLDVSLAISTLVP